MVAIRITNFNNLDDALKELKKKTQDILKESKTRRHFYQSQKKKNY